MFVMIMYNIIGGEVRENTRQVISLQLGELKKLLKDLKLSHDNTWFDRNRREWVFTGELPGISNVGKCIRYIKKS